MGKRLTFPAGFKWGTSTAAAQIETASDHNWRGIRAHDGSIFERTTDHELRRAEDLEHISRFGSIYRCGVDWARLQPRPQATFIPGVIQEYQAFFADLKAKGMEIMFVLHHFAHPRWLEEQGGWAKEDAIPAYINYVQQCLQHFGTYVSYWNTFNEPNVYALSAYLLGDFPPHKKSYFKANRVLRIMGEAHDIAYELIQETYPDQPIGISLNTGHFEGLNTLGKLPATLLDWWFHRKAAKPFEKVDFWGLSYYAYVPFNPLPVTEVRQPGKLKKMGIQHDQMWGYRPEGLGLQLRRFWKRYQKPIIITENGICTDDPKQRIQAIQDYLQVCHAVITEGIPLEGYIFWSTFDNFEWNLGRSYRFGLVTIDWTTMDRRPTAAADFYAEVCTTNSVEV